MEFTSVTIALTVLIIVFVACFAGIIAISNGQDSFYASLEVTRLEVKKELLETNRQNAIASGNEYKIKVAQFDLDQFNQVK